MTAPTPLFQAPRPNTFWASAGYAWRGLIHTVANQRNMRIHMLSAVMVGLVGSGIPLGLAEKVTMIFCVLLVLFAEVLNSALEHIVDLATREIDEHARIAKDAAAAGVLVLSLGTVVIFAAVLVHNAHIVLEHLPAVQRQATFGVPLVLCAGILMHERAKPAWLDAGVFALAVALCMLLWSWTSSDVFSGMTLGLIVVAGDSARFRRRESAKKT